MRIFFYCLFLLLTSIAMPAQEVLTLMQAKERLLQKNFYLLAAYYEINQAEAQLIQARIWNNPVVTWNQEAYSVEQNKFLQARNQFDAQISQTISIAGKHTNTVKLAKINIEITKAQFEDVMRGLMYDLVITYNGLASAEEKEKLYESVLANYEQLIRTTEKELSLGATSSSENIRIKSESFSVKAIALDNANQQEQLMAHLRTLLQYRADTIIMVEQKIPAFNADFNKDSLVAKSISLRPDVKVAKLYQLFNEQNLRLQRSIGVPDVTIGFDYDKGGNYVRDYSGLNLQMPLAIFDRNQGKIKSAKYAIQQSQFQYDYVKTIATNQVIAAHNQYKLAYEGLSNYTPDYMGKLEQLNQNTNLFFQKRNISLLEFIDYQRIYISTKTQLIDLRQQYLNSINNLNFSIGTQLIEF